MRRQLLTFGTRHAAMTTGLAEGLLACRKPEAVRTTVVSTCNRHYSDEASSSSNGWVPSWLKQRLPVGMGGSRGTDELEDLTLDSEYCFSRKGLLQVRRPGPLPDTL